MGLVGFVVACLAAFIGYTKARAFVRNRLRYVDAVHRSSTPWKAGLVAALLGAPIAWALPFLTMATALLFGTAVGLGVAAGQRDLRRGMPAHVKT